MEKLTNYYYIDESGSILNNATLFIHGCIISDTPDLLTQSLLQLKDKIENKLYYEEFIKDVGKLGFHAVDNHPDIRKEYYENLFNLNWRAYFVVINKESEYFKNLSTKEEYEIFTISLRKLLDNRIIKRKNDINKLKFETIELSKKSLKNVLKEIFDSIPEEFNCEYEIVGKDELNMSIVDYLNYILFQILSNKKQIKRMEQNFNIFSPKIGMIHFPHSNTYLTNSKETLDLENLKKYW